MTDFLGRFGQWAMVAGAAEGLGEAYSEALARLGKNLIMVDVRKTEVESLALKLEKMYNIKTECLIIDLGDHDAAGDCMKAVRSIGCRLMVYNAAYSRVKPFLSAGTEEPDLYVDVNVRTPLKLVHAFSTYLKTSSKNGGILLMSSLAGLWGTRLVAFYSGTKAFNLALAEALHHELKPYNIEISACCAGATATPAYLGTNPSYGFIRPNVMQPDKVASVALKRLGKKAIIIPGFINRLTYFFLTRILPRSLSARLVNKTMARTYEKVVGR